MKFPPWFDQYWMVRLKHTSVKLVWTGKHTRCLRSDGTTAPSGVAAIYGAVDEGFHWPPPDQTKEGS